MTEEEFAPNFEEVIEQTAGQSVEAGFPSLGSVDRARETMERLLPDGLRTEGMDLLVFEQIQPDGSAVAVGWTWLGLPGRGEGQSENAGWMYYLYMDPAHRKQGMTTEFNRVLMPEMRRRGVSKLGAEIFAPNAASLATAKKFGWQTVAHLVEYRIPPEESE